MNDTARTQLKRHLKGLFGFALTLSHDDDEARDLVQDTAMKALGARNVPADATAFRVWLFRILHNTWRDRVRRIPVATAAIEEADDRPRGAGWTEIHEQRINVIAVRISFEKLSRAHRQVIALVDIAGLTYAEAGAVLDLPTGTIMSRLSRARQAMLAAMKDDDVIPISPALRRTP